MHEDFRAVTLAQLCSNRGGVPGDLSADGLWRTLWRDRGAPRDARRILLEGVVTKAPIYKPGQGEQYANGGLAIAGHMCETLAKKPYEELITELLFQPLGMTTAGFGAPGTPLADPAAAPDQPRGHDRKDQPQEPTADGRGADNPPAITPAGRVHASLADWGKFIQFHLRGSRGKPQTLAGVELPAELFTKLHTPPDKLSEYAFGWIAATRPWAAPKREGAAGDLAGTSVPGQPLNHVFYHNGSNTMWFCVTWIAPNQDFAVLVTTNRADSDGAAGTDAAAWQMIQHVLKSRAAPADR